MQTNTKAKQQPKGNNWVLTPEIMVLSILLVATLEITTLFQTRDFCAGNYL